MSLIKCPECGKEVSDKSQNCIHCGYPINSHKVIMENINGVDYDVSFLADMSLSQWEKLGKMLEITGNDFENAMKAKEIVLKYHPTKTVEESRKPHCPTCQSTNLKKFQPHLKRVQFLCGGYYPKSQKNMAL